MKKRTKVSLNVGLVVTVVCAVMAAVVTLWVAHQNREEQRREHSQDTRPSLAVQPLFPVLSSGKYASWDVLVRNYGKTVAAKTQVCKVLSLVHNPTSVDAAVAVEPSLSSGCEHLGHEHPTFNIAPGDPPLPTSCLARVLTDKDVQDIDSGSLLVVVHGIFTYGGIEYEGPSQPPPYHTEFCYYWKPGQGGISCGPKYNTVK